MEPCRRSTLFFFAADQRMVGNGSGVPTRITELVMSFMACPSFSVPQEHLPQPQRYLYRVR